MERWRRYKDRQATGKLSLSWSGEVNYLWAAELREARRAKGFTPWQKSIVDSRFKFEVVIISSTVSQKFFHVQVLKMISVRHWFYFDIKAETETLKKCYQSKCFTCICVDEFNWVSIDWQSRERKVKSSDVWDRRVEAVTTMNISQETGLRKSYFCSESHCPHNHSPRQISPYLESWSRNTRWWRKFKRPTQNQYDFFFGRDCIVCEVKYKSIKAACLRCIQM